VSRSKADRLRRLAPSADDSLITALASQPAGTVSVVAMFARQAVLDDRQRQAEARRQRKADARQHRHWDEDDLTARTLRLIEATAARAAGGDLRALAALAQFSRAAKAGISEASLALDAMGLPDTTVGQALGQTPDAVQKRRSRRQLSALISRGERA
jgi:hypothetical protein